MTRTEAQVATHVIRSHRRLRRGLPELQRLATLADGPTHEHARIRAARSAARFLDRNVLAHADVEDAVVDRYLNGRATRGSAARLQPQHDTLREAGVRLHDYVEVPSESVDLAGLLQGTTQVLRAHMDDEWQILVPALSSLDDTGCAACEPLVSTSALAPSAHVYLPLPFGRAQRLLTRRPHELRRRLAQVAAAAVRRQAHRVGVPVRDDLRLVIDLVPAVQAPHVGLHVGALRSGEMETVLSPLEFELALTDRGDSFTELEVHHVMTPVRPLPADAPAHELTDTALHAVVGELATIAGDRNPTFADVWR